MAHYKRDLKYGDPNGGPRGMRTPDGVPMTWFLSHLDYKGNDCLKWPFADRGNGYGALVVADGRTLNAHREMCIRVHGEPPFPGAVAAHSCGNGHNGCVNPNHLRWATQAENSADMHIHGTAQVGIKSARAKLTENQVKEIMAARGKITQVRLAEIYGVKQAHISKIQLGGVWDHLRNAN